MGPCCLKMFTIIVLGIFEAWVEVNTQLLASSARSIISNSICSDYSPNMRESKKEKLQTDLINTNWIMRFTQASLIVFRAQSEKLQSCNTKI